MRILILCAGDQTRWGNFQGVPKHLVELIGEPILHRTVRLLSELAPDADVRVVVKNPKDNTYKVPGSKRAGAKLDPGNGDADKFLSSAHLWDTKGRTVLLYGDAFFTREALEKILTADTQGGWWFAGRFDGSRTTGAKGGECFAFILDPDGHEVFRAALDRVVTLRKTGVIPRNGGWETYRALMGVEDEKILEHFGDGSPKNPNLGHCTVVDDWTEDFDSPTDWHEWCWHYAHAAVKPT